MAERIFSEAAKSFFEQFSKILEDFKKETGFQVFLLNKEGKLVTKLEGVQSICKTILSFEEGKTRCKDAFQMGFSLMKRERKPIFLECYAHFAICYLPIIVANSLVGSVIICGGRYDKGESEEELKKRFYNLADELGIFDKESFFQKAKEVKVITEEDFKKEAEKLMKLIEILTENVQTPLKEILG